MDKYKCFMEISKRYMGILYKVLKLFYIFEITSKYASHLSQYGIIETEFIFLPYTSKKWTTYIN